MQKLNTLLAGILLSASFAWAEQTIQTELTAPTSESTQQLMAQVEQLIDSYYVDEVDKRKLLDGAIKGMLSTLDPNSTYLTEQSLEMLRSSNRGHYYGYGIEVSTSGDQVEIVTPLEGSSAAAAGILPGDILLRVDELVADPSDMEPLISYIKQASTADRSLLLTLQRHSNLQPLQFELAPSPITVSSSRSLVLADQVGYLRISSFNRRTAIEVRRSAFALSKLPLKGLVLDLRNNPGGLLDSAVRIADIFIDDGTIVTTHGRFNAANSDYQATSFHLFAQLPMVVLINQGSASAAEIVAGALQDHGRAQLMGQRSFGKGTVQSLIPLVDDGGAIKLTTAHYATPNGTFIDQKGIEPDFSITLADEQQEDIVIGLNLENQWTDDPQIFAAYDYIMDNQSR
ncbi:S41 family peptidase [Ferrimonas lipolytica]|uniref:S41 family peptidase n=1 Tax=Ferrimonas lipolytica TaxID=2724191 RepID=A0A6H1UGP7_9GAMM|nr:S41 family peptidase [Ferrimonas lipolytica]QIZ78261.1 S41 family peptidase [Ferrimonas lipolytica]